MPLGGYRGAMLEAAIWVNKCKW